MRKSIAFLFIASIGCGRGPIDVGQSPIAPSAPSAPHAARVPSATPNPVEPSLTPVAACVPTSDGVCVLCDGCGAGFCCHCGGAGEPCCPGGPFGFFCDADSAPDHSDCHPDTILCP